MTRVPAQPKIYHITHVDNLAGIAQCGELLSDRLMLAGGGPARSIGMSAIKRRRIEDLEVHCHPGTRVGDFVPFYFCPRSVMLYVIHRANHPELAYRGGQGEIVHLEADLRDVVRWAGDQGRRWAFSLSNAGAYYATFRSQVQDLEQLDWQAIASTDFRFHERFPFDLFQRIGVQSATVQARATRALNQAGRRIAITVRPYWYY